MAHGNGIMKGMGFSFMKNVLFSVLIQFRPRRPGPLARPDQLDKTRLRLIECRYDSKKEKAKLRKSFFL